MSKLIETKGARHWLQQLKSSYNLSHTTLNISDSAFTVMLDSSITGNNNVLVGRYCRYTKVGVVRDRRSERRVGY